MASGLVSTRPQAESPPVQGRYGDFIHKRLEHTRRQVRLADVVSAMMLLATVSLLFFLAVALLDHWVFQHGLSFTARLGLFALWIAGAGIFAWRFLVPPLVNRINPVFAAHTIEQGRPTLKNSLINFLLLRAHPQDVAPVVFRAMEHRAAADLLKVPVDHAVDRSRMVKLAVVLAAIVAVFALYLVLSPKNPLLSAARVLWPWSSIPAPTRVHIEEVRPGDEIVFNDDSQEISALVSGLRDGEEVALWVSTADGQVVDDRVIMTRTDDANHFHSELPPGNTGFQQDTFYRITAGDAATPKYKLEVHIAPTIVVDSIEYHFPAYTGEVDRTIKNQGDIKALEGTQVTIHASANMDIQDARIDLGCDGLRMLPMTTKGAKASGQFTLALDGDDKAGRKAQYDRYQILFTDSNGHNVRRPVQYHIDVDPDLSPEIEIREPAQQEVAVAEDGQLPIRVHARDIDYGLRRVTLQAEREGQPLDVWGVLLNCPKPQKAWTKPYDGEYVFRPADLKLKAGDVVTYWATAEDNKEPRPNHNETAHRTIKIVGSGQGSPQEQQNQANGGDGPKQPNEDKPSQGGQRNKAEQGKGDSSRSKDASKEGGSDDKSKQGGVEKNPQDRQPGDGKDPGQPDNSGGPGKSKASSDPSKDQKNSEANSGDAGDQPHEKVNPNEQRSDAIKDALKDLEEQKKGQQDKAEQKQAEKPDSGQENPNQPNNPQQGNPQSGGQKPGDQKQNGNQGGQQPQGNAGEKNTPGAGNQEPQGGNQQPQSGKPDSAQSNTGKQPQGGEQSPNGQGDPKPSPQQDKAGNPSSGGQQEKGGKESGNQSSQQNAGGGQGNESKPSGGPKDGQNAGGGQSKPDSKQAGGQKDQQNQPAGGEPKSEKPKAGSKGGGDERQTAPSGAKPDEKKQPGTKGGGDDKQLAQAAAKPDAKKPPGSGGSESSSPLPGGPKPGEKPKPENGNSAGGGQTSKSKPQEKQDGSGKSGGGDKPKPGQGDQEGSNGGKKPGGSKGGNKGGTADGQQGQKDPGKSGDATQQDSHGAPAPQVDPEHPGNKAGDAHEGLNPKSDNPQSPGNSPHNSNSTSESRGDRKGGGGAGGGQPDKKTGKGAAGTSTAAPDGGAVSNEQGDDATGKNAGQQVRAGDPSGSPHKEPGKGNGEKQEPSENLPAKDDAQKPQGDPTQNSAESQDKSSGGQAGAPSSQQAGSGGSGLPLGGSQANNSDKPVPPPREPEAEPDAANLEFTKKQVDLALEHLKDEKAKPKSDLLDRLGWTKEEAERFVENMKKLQDAAQQSGNEGEAAKKAYNEFLKNLDLHPHGTRIGGGHTKTDDMRGVRDSGQMQPPSDWADLYHAYSHATAGEK